jgi:hypothetical protein
VTIVCGHDHKQYYHQDEELMIGGQGVKCDVIGTTVYGIGVKPGDDAGTLGIRGMRANFAIMAFAPPPPMDFGSFPPPPAGSFSSMDLSFPVKTDTYKTFVSSYRAACDNAQREDLLGKLRLFSAEINIKALTGRRSLPPDVKKVPYEAVLKEIDHTCDLIKLCLMRKAVRDRGQLPFGDRNHLAHDLCEDLTRKIAFRSQFLLIVGDLDIDLMTAPYEDLYAAIDEMDLDELCEMHNAIQNGDFSGPNGLTAQQIGQLQGKIGSRMDGLEAL